MFVTLVRQTWGLLLAAAPQRLLEGLDGMARHSAQRRAAHRRQALLARSRR